MSTMKKISCFSYKGGAGRSTLALNVIPFLAEELGASAEHPFVVIDMDVDSCGITYLFDLGDSVPEFYNVQSMFGSNGVVYNRGSGIGADILRNLPAVGSFYGLDDNAIRCLPAMPGERFSDGANYDCDDSKFRSFINLCEQIGCCGVLFDSAVGNQLTADWSNTWATHIMCCLRPTKQFREGTKRFFDEFDEKIGEKKIIIIPNVVPTDPLDLMDNGTMRHYPEHAKSEIISSFSDNITEGENEYILDMLEGDSFGIPKIDRFMWQEGVLSNSINTLNDLERVALRQYKKIASIIKEH